MAHFASMLLLSEKVLALIRPSFKPGCAGKIESLCERGLDEDAGRYRLTFFYESRRFRLLVDEEGNVIRHSLVDFGNR